MNTRSLAVGAVGAAAVAVAATDVVTLFEPTPLTYALEAVVGGAAVAAADSVTGD
jgi:hypothetical protein